MAFKKDPSFWNNQQDKEEYAYIMGVNQSVDEKMLIRPHTRYLMASTDVADGVSFRRLGVSTDGFGYGRTGFDAHGIYSGRGRGLAIFQFLTSTTPEKFGTVFAGYNGGSNEEKTITAWTTAATASTATLGTQTNSSFPSLPTHTQFNGFDMVADLNNLYKTDGANVFINLIQQPLAPSVVAVASAGYVYSAQVGTAGSGNAQFTVPSGVAVDASGNVFVGNTPVITGNNDAQSQKFSSVLSYLSTVNNARGSKPVVTFIAEDSSSNLYMAIHSLTVTEIQKFNSSGTGTLNIGAAGVGAGQFTRPQGIVIDGSSNVYVCDSINNNVQKFNSSGVFQSAFSGVTLSSPMGIAQDGSGNFWVVDSGNNAVQKFNSSGVWQATFTSSFSAPTGITIDASNNIFVVDSGNNQVKVFNNSMTLLSTFGSLGSGNGQFNNPTAIANKSGTVYVVDTGNSRLESFVVSSTTGNYAYTLIAIDSNGNESLPSTLSTVALSGQQAQLTINSNGLEATATGWKKIRIYRTLINTSIVVAANNPIFYYVPGLDVTLVNGTTSYVVYDGVPDTTLQAVTNFSMTNVAYSSGILQALDTTLAPKFVCTFNGQVFGGYWSGASGTFKRRIYWSNSTDNSGLSNGNITSWNALNFIDVGTDADGEIIGLYPGLQGRLYIFKQLSTYLLQPTGNSVLPFSVTPISSEYGMYHHSISETIGAVYGRTKDGIAIFNGTTFKHISHNLYPLISRSVAPYGDSGVYDFTTQRYYLAICDPSLSQSSNTSNPTSGNADLLYSYRNTVIAYDVNTGSFEIHARCPIQVFQKFKDTNGTQSIFAVGMNSDIYQIMEQGDISGPSVSGIATVAAFNQITTTGISLPAGMIGKQIYLTYFDNSAANALVFTSYLSTITAVSGTTVTVNDPLPYSTNAYICSFFIDNAGGTIGATSSNIQLLDTNNYFQSSNVDHDGFIDVSPTTFQAVNNYLPQSSGLTVSSTTKLVPQSSNFGFSPTVGDLYVLTPYLWFSAQNPVPVRLFRTPPFGTRLNDEYQKMFTELWLWIKGTGTLVVNEFQDGNYTAPTATYTMPIKSNAQFNWQKVSLKGNHGIYTRFDIFMVRGTGRFEIMGTRGYYRLMEALSVQQ